MNYAIKKRIKQLYTRLIKHKTETVAADLARQCRAAVTHQIVGKSKVLSPEQMRGYVRAYATCSLDSIIDKRDDIKRLNSSQISKVILQAKEIPNRVGC